MDICEDGKVRSLRMNVVSCRNIVFNTIPGIQNQGECLRLLSKSMTQVYSITVNNTGFLHIRVTEEQVLRGLEVSLIHCDEFAAVAFNKSITLF